MAGFDYECEGQINIFQFIGQRQQFNPLEALALTGTGFSNGMKRVYNYFSEDHTLEEKAQFLKKEYGAGGFGTPTKKPCYVHSMNTYGNTHNGIEFEYYDEAMNNMSASVTWTEFAKVITSMINNESYIERRLVNE